MLSLQYSLSDSNRKMMMPNEKLPYLHFKYACMEENLFLCVCELKSFLAKLIDSIFLLCLVFSLVQFSSVHEGRCTVERPCLWLHGSLRRHGIF